MSTFVSVGNAVQPFPRLLNAVARIIGELPSPVFVQHGRTPFDHAGCTAVPFVDMEQFAREVKGASVLILHAGAGSMIHAIGAGKIPIVVARRARFGEVIDDHQVDLAEVLAREKWIRLVDDLDTLAAVVRDVQREGERPAEREPSRLIRSVGRIFDDVSASR